MINKIGFRLKAYIGFSNISQLKKSLKVILRRKMLNNFYETNCHPHRLGRCYRQANKLNTKQYTVANTCYFHVTVFFQVKIPKCNAD